MTGSDFLWFLQEIWSDVTNLGTADLPSLGFRLIVLVLLILFVTYVLRTVLTVLGGLLRAYVVPLVRLVWDVLTAPVWVPYRLVRRVWRRVQERRQHAHWVREQQRLKEEEARKRLAEEVRERERIAELQKVLKVD